MLIVVLSLIFLQGTWQFMSVAYINSQWRHPIAVADELEAFFHVLIFWAVRFLPHTAGLTSVFVVEYFDTFSLEDDGRHICGLSKESLMHCGEFPSGVRTLQFLKTNRDPGNPINTLIESMLELFKARYEIMKYERSSQKAPIKRDPTPSGSNPSDRMPAFPLLKTRQKKTRQVRASPKAARAPCAPTEKTKSLAARLDNHDWVLSLFEEVQDTESTPPEAWRNTWVVQDQLVDYEPRIILKRRGTTTQTTGTRETDDGSIKRPRTAGSNFAISSGQLPETGSSQWSVLSNSGPA